MHNLLYAHNRKYYRQVVRIRLRLYWRLYRLGLGADFVKLGCWISPDLEKAINARHVHERRECQ